MAQYGKDPKTGEDHLTQEYWASRAQDILISKTADTSVVYDLKKGYRSTTKAEQVIERNVHLERDAHERARRSMEGLLGLSPGGAPWDAELNEIEDPAQAAVGVEVYELAWESSRFGGPGEPKKWRVYVDSKTNLPRKAEFFQWDRLEEKFFLATTRRFDYPPEDDILRRRDALLSGNY
jgi:hypothetical protein